MTSLVSVSQGASTLDVLAQRYRAAFDKMQGGREQWIEGTLELAGVILEARELLPVHQEYGRWLTRNQLEHFHPNDRMALIGFGQIERKKSGAGRKLLEDNFGLAWRTIWEKKRVNVPIPALTRSGKGPYHEKSGASKRNRIPDVMRDDNPPPPKPERKGIVLKGLTREQVDPDFKGTPLEFTTIYGHVNLQTKQQINYHKQQELLMAWIGTVTEFERAGRAMLAALPPVDPAALKEWLAKPGKTDKMQGWSRSIQVACEALYNMISNV